MLMRQRVTPTRFGDQICKAIETSVVYIRSSSVYKKFPNAAFTDHASWIKLIEVLFQYIPLLIHRVKVIFSHI